MELPMLSASQCDHTQKAGESKALLVASGPFWAAMIAFLSVSEDHEDYTQDSRCILPWGCQCICQVLLGISPAGSGWPAVWSTANQSKQTSFSVALSTVVNLQPQDAKQLESEDKSKGDGDITISWQKRNNYMMDVSFYVFFIGNYQ